MANVCKYCQAVFSLTPDKLHVLKEQLKLDPSEHPLSSTAVQGERNLLDDLRETVSTCHRIDTENATVQEEPLSKKLKLSPAHLQDKTTPILVDITDCAHCVACLGLNSEEYIETLVNVILEKMDHANYEGVSSFVLAIHAPLSLKVRRMGMEHLVRSMRQWDSDPTATKGNSSKLVNSDKSVVTKGDKENGLCSGESRDLSESSEQSTNKHESLPFESEHQNEACSNITPTDPPSTNSPPEISTDSPTKPVNSPPTTSTNPSPPDSKSCSDEYYVKSNVRSRVKYQIEKRRPKLTYNVDSPFLITVKLDHMTSDEDCTTLIHMSSISIPKPKVKRRNRKFEVQTSQIVTTTAVHDALEAITVKDFTENNFFLTAVEECCSYEIEFLHRPIFVGGRYNKYSRTLPQTPWILDGVRKVESSVEELICDKITDLVRASGHNFSSSGREDVDVRMLGNGRPFLVEFINPRNISFAQDDLAKIQVEINDATNLIEVRQLKRVTREATKVLKQGEQEKQKCYSALIWTPEEITSENIKFLDDLKDVAIDQKTPIRVLHRRSLSTRQRMVYSLQTTFINKHHFRLDLTTQAGTYVKEFVHGDFGRTQPNLRVMLKQDVDILSLDVLEVKLEWPL